MLALDFELELTSSAEPGTGLGGELINDRFPRDAQGRPTIPGSHLKGLLREQWQALLPGLCLADGAALTAAVFGQAFAAAEAPAAEGSVLHLGDLAWHSGPEQGELIARTALVEPDDAASGQPNPEAGTAKPTSLRIVEAIPAGTRFRGTLVWRGQDPRGEAALRLALLALEAVGGNRQRGAGRCVVRLLDRTGQPKDPPARWAAELVQRLRAPSAAPAARSASAALPDPGPARWWQLVFVAREPVLCLEHPEAANHLQGMACIPGSAVLGAIASRVAAELGADAAKRLLEHPAVRAGGLWPSGFTASRGLAMPAPLSLRIPKGARSGAIDTLLATEAAADGMQQPKAFKGTLVLADDGVHPLFATDVPRFVRAQVGLSDGGGPRLFSYDAVGPCAWSGLLCLPAGWEDLVSRLVADIAFGRRRSALGHGTAQLVPLPPPAQLGPLAKGARLALVAQSPVLAGAYPGPEDGFPDPVAVLIELTSQWIEQHRLPLAIAQRQLQQQPSIARPAVLASLGIRFGWNRHRRGLQEAVVVLTPGSTIVLEATADIPAEALMAALQAGLGPGREHGYGTLWRHPGAALASRLEPPAPTPPVLPASDALLQKMLAWATRTKRLPSPSQVGQLCTLAAAGDPVTLRNHLKKQCERTRFRDDYLPLQQLFAEQPWQDAIDRLRDEQQRRRFLAALRLLQDIAIARQQEE